jgi:hypothetical protein
VRTTTGGMPSNIKPDRARYRRPVWALEPRAIRLLDALPEALRLFQLRRHYPHVLNQLAQRWHDAGQMQQLIQSLLIDQRGNREGFPPDAQAEVQELADYYFSVIRPQIDHSAVI